VLCANASPCDSGFKKNSLPSKPIPKFGVVPGPRCRKERVNLEMRANAIEATEQCGILAIPAIAAPLYLPAALAGLAAACHLVFRDEDAPARW